MKYELENIISTMKRNLYDVFEKDSNPLNLNLVAVRSNPGEVNKFDDWFYLFCKYQGKWEVREYLCTTDPGLYWMKNPENVQGVAILKEGQYHGMWSVGRHRNLYPALVQTGKCTVYRDNNKDEFHDIDGLTDNGCFGINCHKAGFEFTAEINKWSGGCVVFADSKAFDTEFMVLCKKASEIYGNSFTFTLLNQKEIV